MNAFARTLHRKKVLECKNKIEKKEEKEDEEKEEEEEEKEEKEEEVGSG